MGIRLLLLGQQLFDRWPWRCGLTGALADVGAAGKHYWRVDEWNIGQRSVCDNHSARQPRNAIIALIFRLWLMFLLCFVLARTNRAKAIEVAIG